MFKKKKKRKTTKQGCGIQRRNERHQRRRIEGETAEGRCVFWKDFLGLGGFSGEEKSSRPGCSEHLFGKSLAPAMHRSIWEGPWELPRGPALQPAEFTRTEAKRALVNLRGSQAPWAQLLLPRDNLLCKCFHPPASILTWPWSSELTWGHAEPCWERKQNAPNKRLLALHSRYFSKGPCPPPCLRITLLPVAPGVAWKQSRG